MECAQPYWIKADKATEQIRLLKEQIKITQNDLKTNPDNKALQKNKLKLEDKLTKQNKIHKSNQQAGDSVYYTAFNLDIKNPHQPEEEKQYSSAELLDMLHQSFAKGDELLNQLKRELSP